MHLCIFNGHICLHAYVHFLFFYYICIYEYVDAIPCCVNKLHNYISATFWFKHILLNKKHIVNTNLQTFQAVDKNER